MNGIKTIAAKWYAKWTRNQISKWARNPHSTQEKLFKKLIQKAENTQFGLDHNFKNIKTYEDFVGRVPVRDYEALRPYVDKVVDGLPNVLWPGKPLFFAKTSGTTSGTKYIPISKDSMPMHIRAAKQAILCYIEETGDADIVSGKMIFLQGSPVLSEKNGVKVGRLSGIVAHYVPAYLQKNRMPSWETNCIEDWEAKVAAIVEETSNEDMRVISGIPPWVQMYFEKLVQKSNQTVGQIFPNFKLFIYGGVNFEPYRNTFEELIGRKVSGIELYPASEGFFAFQDRQNEKGMLLQLHSGIFYEFIKSDEFFNENPKRLNLASVELGVNYVMIISTTAGLWAYNLGDTVQFTSLKPYKLVVSGRIKHFISAFGEHVIGKEVEEAMQEALSKTTAQINEFTVAPQITPPEGGLPYHEWFVEFEKKPSNLNQFVETLEASLQGQNVYYKDLIAGKILRPLVLRLVQKRGFQSYMKDIGKLGGQNKTPRLSNDRKIAEALQQYVE